MLSLAQSSFFWLSLGLVFIILELLLPGVYLLWVGIGALLVAVPTFLFVALPLATILIILVVCVALAVWVGLQLQRRNQHASAQVNVGLDTYIGQRVYVATVSDHNPHELRILLAGTTYPAYCKAQVQPHDEVIIEKVHSGRFIVKPSS